MIQAKALAEFDGVQHRFSGSDVDAVEAHEYVAEQQTSLGGRALGLDSDYDQPDLGGAGKRAPRRLGQAHGL